MGRISTHWVIYFCQRKNTDVHRGKAGNVNDESGQVLVRRKPRELWQAGELCSLKGEAIAQPQTNTGKSKGPKLPDHLLSNIKVINSDFTYDFPILLCWLVFISIAWANQNMSMGCQCTASLLCKSWRWSLSNGTEKRGHCCRLGLAADAETHRVWGQDVYLKPTPVEGRGQSRIGQRGKTNSDTNPDKPPPTWQKVSTSDTAGQSCPASVQNRCWISITCLGQSSDTCCPGKGLTMGEAALSGSGRPWGSWVLKAVCWPHRSQLVEVPLTQQEGLDI